MTAAIKKTRIDAEANGPSRPAPFNKNRLTAAVAYVLTCISNKSNLYILGLLAGLSAISISLPAAPLDSKQAVDNLYITSWTAKDGLPGSVLGLAQTTDGFLWIAGSEGLFRFDGLAIERYTPQNGVLLHDAVLRSLLPSSDGGLWIGYGLGGASFLKNGKITNYTAHDGLPAGLTRCFVQDKDGTVWAAFAGGLARFDGQHWQKIQMNWNYAGKTSFGVVVDHAGTVWAASEDRIFFLPRGARMFQDSGLSTTSGKLVIAPDHTLWLLEPRSKSMVPLQLQSGRLKRGSTRIEVEDWEPIFDHGGGLWIGSWGNGVLHIPSPNDLREGTFSRLSPEAQPVTEADGLSDNHVTQFLEDREGNIWVGTNGGLDRLRHRNLSWFVLQPGAHDFSLIPGPGGEIFAASAFGGMEKLPLGTPVQSAPGNVTAAYRDSEGVVWLICFDGTAIVFHASLFQWTDGHFNKIGVPPDLENLRFRAMTKDSAGNLWISKPTKGVYKFRNGVWTHVDIFKDNPTASAAAAITDTMGRIWLAFPQRKEIAVITAGAVRSFSTEKEVPIGPVSLLAQSGEQIYAGGDLGIALFQGDAFHVIKAEDGNTFADVDRVVATAFDGVWLSAQKGIVHIPNTEIEHVIRDSSYKVKYETFDQASGLPDPLQVSGSGYVSAIQGDDGVLWFATRNGVARIDPRRILKNDLAPPVSIRSVSADGKDYVFDSGASLPALTKNLRVAYTGLSLSIPEKVKFRYKLDGWDKAWQYAGVRREVFYTNLAPGTYRFHVTACNNDGVWNDVGAAVDIRIPKAWYQTNWFVTLCVLAALAILWAFHRLRMRQIARGIGARFDERLAERTRMARDLHDTFLQTIQGSKLVADDALDEPGDPVRMRRAMEKLSLWLGQATREGRAALNSLRTSTTETNDLAQALQRATEDSPIPSAMAVNFTLMGDAKRMHPIVRDEIYRIGYEAIRNACVHSSASQLEVELTYGQDLALRVADNGVGIDSAIVDRGKQGHFGLQGMRERAVRIGGRLTLASSSASGTEIKLVVPGGIIFQKTMRVRQTLLARMRAVVKRMNQTSNLD